MGRHVGDAVHGVDAEAMGGEAREGLLGHVDGKVAIESAFPSEGRAEEEVDVTHEVHLDFGSQELLEAGFDVGVGGEEDEVVDASADGNWCLGG